MTERYRHILVATDGSDTARRAFDRGLDLALGARARVTLVHVVEKEAGPAIRSDDFDASRSHLGGRLAEFEQVAREAGVKIVRTRTESGLPDSRSLGLAEAEGGERSVLGAHGWGTGGGLGEVASHVVKFANCSVLVVR